jgi:hypothetical protein
VDGNAFFILSLLPSAQGWVVYFKILAIIRRFLIIVPAIPYKTKGSVLSGSIKEIGISVLRRSLIRVR